MKAYKIYKKSCPCSVRFFRTRKEAYEYKKSSDIKWSAPIACQVFGIEV